MSIGFMEAVRAAALVYVLLFIFYPLAYFAIFVLSAERAAEMVRLLGSDLFLSSLRKSLIVSVSTAVLTALLGLPYAYFLHRYKIRGKRFVLSATFLPTMIPPFVGSLAVIYLLGRFGTINLILLELGVISRPINFIYGLHGVVLVQVLALFPWVAINVYNNLLKIDRTLEEAAETLGASPFKRFITVTLPAAVPGLATGIFMVFSFSFTDYATPIVLGQYELLAPQAFVNIQQAIDESRVRAGAYMVFFMLAAVVFAFLASRKYITLKEYASLRPPRPVEEVELSGLKKVGVTAFVYAMLSLALLPHAFVFVISVSKAWSLTPLPTAVTLENYGRALGNWRPIANTALYASLGTLFCLLLGVFAAYVVARTGHPLNTVIDTALSMMFVVPGIVVGTSYLLAFRRDLPIVGVLGATWLIMPLMLATRRITYTVRYSYAAYLLLRRSLEESAYVLSDRPFTTFARIVMPNAIYGILAGALFSFVEIINELTASLFIYKPGWETVTIQMFIEIIAGRMPVAAAYAVLLLISSAVIAYAALALAAKVR
jgi:iron(III) transport system permease protein